MTRADDLPWAVHAVCRTQGFGQVVAADALLGGAISRTHRIHTASGITLILKQSVDAPPGLYAAEAAGLRRLATAGALRTPTVVAAASELLVLEDLGTRLPADGYWEAFGRALALQHRSTSPRFGWEHDNYLGRLPQRNGWLADGHAFFAERRILRYVTEPRCMQTLAATDRAGLERLCARLPELIPAQPAALLHGDLWYANMLVGSAGEPAVIDPAVYYGWPEAELSMVWQCGQVPDVFYAAYAEVAPLEAGWRERLEVLSVREILSMVAHFGNQYGSLAKLRAVLQRFG